MNSKPTIPAATLHDLLAVGRHPVRDRHLDGILAARRAAESAIGIAMVTSAIPGLEVHYLDDEIITVTAE